MHLSALLANFTQPLTQAATLFAAGAFGLCVGRIRIGGAFCVLGVGWLGLCATPVFAEWLVAGLEADYPPHRAAAYSLADAIVVLGGGGLPHFESDAPDESGKVRGTRTGFGLALFRANRAPLIILSGGDGEAEAMARLLHQHGIPASSLIDEGLSRNTYENALYSAALLRRNRLQRILLVTSPIHMRRAAACFNRQGLIVIPAPAPTRQISFARSWLPQSAALKLSGSCLREIIALWIYKWRDWA